MLMSWVFSLAYASVCAYAYACAYALVKTSLKSFGLHTGVYHCSQNIFCVNAVYILWKMGNGMSQF